MMLPFLPWCRIDRAYQVGDVTIKRIVEMELPVKYHPEYSILPQATPEELRKMVVTPGGTTAAGLAAMAELKTTDGLIAAVEAAAKRGAEMAQENK